MQSELYRHLSRRTILERFLKLQKNTSIDQRTVQLCSLNNSLLKQIGGFKRNIDIDNAINENV